MNITEFTKDAIKDEIVEFLRTAKEGKYLKKIDSLSGPNLQIEYSDVFDYDQSEFSIFELLNKNPSQFIQFCMDAIKTIYAERYGLDRSKDLDLTIMIDKSELEMTIPEALKNKHLNRLVTISALVNGESEIQSRLLDGTWFCSKGHKTVTNGDKMPLKCNNDKCTERKLEIDYDQCSIESYRTLYLKDVNFSDHHGDTLIAEAIGELSDLTKIGDVVKFTGYVTPEHRDKRLFNVLYILGISITNKIDYQITEGDKKIYDEWPRLPNFYQRMINSLAPEIYKNELNKEAFLLAYVGAPNWNKNQRYWINVLAVGDPATAKSKIAQWANNVLANVEFVSSKAGSAKGLFAGQKEQVDGKKVLEVGPMVKSSGRGIVCIDEFGRMPEVFDIFYSPMETGSFNSATVGGHANLSAETPIYATGNPKRSNKWDENKSVVDNLQVFEPSMLSRFDLIIIVKDEGDSHNDKKIAESILGLRATREKPEIFSELDIAKYLLYCKTVNPVLTSEVSRIIIDVFSDIRKQARGMTTEHQEITSRLVGTITRLTLAIARLHLRRETTEEDVSLARRLLENMLQQRGLKVNNANTYIDRIGQKILTILESSLVAMTDQEIYEKLMITFPDQRDSIRNDVGGDGPHREQNKRWRSIMENIEKSYLIEIESMKPKRLKYKHGQAKL